MLKNGLFMRKKDFFLNEAFYDIINMTFLKRGVFIMIIIDNSVSLNETLLSANEGDIIYLKNGEGPAISMIRLLIK